MVAPQPKTETKEVTAPSVPAKVTIPAKEEVPVKVPEQTIKPQPVKALEGIPVAPKAPISSSPVLPPSPATVASKNDLDGFNFFE